MYTRGQKIFLWCMTAVLGAALFLPATYGMYTFSEKVGGLIPMIGIWLGGMVSIFLFSTLTGGEWPEDIDGRKATFSERLVHFLKTGLMSFLFIAVPSLIFIIVSYWWLIAGVAPFEKS